ncbi:DUF5011 domain-containing protein [Clostridium paraputrificum]|uniref:Calcineurin-like phosphoesterase n=1 Tax=Clostridium paraputrificum TaxID=29363 RepID=A0A6N3ED19_9CLOT
MIRRKLYRSKIFSLVLATLLCLNPIKAIALDFQESLIENTNDKLIRLSEVKDKELLITEILPDSSNVNGSDAYEFIEIYNNSNRELNLKDYKLYYNYPDKGDGSDVLWIDINNDVKIQSGEAIVFWIKNEKNNHLTVDDFNKKFDTKLELNTNIFELYNGGMANSGARALRLTTSIYEQVDLVSYNMDGVKDTSADKSIKYKYDDASNKSIMISNNCKPDPGIVNDEDKPTKVLVNKPENLPVVENMTSDTFTDDEGLIFKVNATSEETNIKTVKLSYKSNKMNEYETYNLLKGENNIFTKEISKYDLIGKAYYDYYFEVSDGFEVVKTDVKRITNLELDDSNIRFNINENEFLNGVKNVITTGEELLIDGENKTLDSVSSIENNAKIVFDIKETDVFFKNAVAIGDTVLGIFNEGTYDNWDTVAFDVDPTYFKKGETIQIDIHAGNKANALEHNEENNDDFVTKNIRLVLPDGTILRPKGYENPEEVIQMGDSDGKVEVLNAVFSPSNDSFNALRYELNTIELEDGEHSLSGVINELNEREDVKFLVDNTAPEIFTNIENEKVYKGTNTITVDAKDDISGMNDVTAKLDGRNIELPYEFRSLELSPGYHTLIINARDNCNNESIKEVKFIIPEESAEIGLEIKPGNGEMLDSDPIFSIHVKDSTDDIMTVDFKKGERYVLGDSNISKAEGISQTSGTSDLAFTEGSANGFPYEAFDIELSDDVNENATIKVEWTGVSNNLKTKMYVYNYFTGAFDIVSTEDEIIENKIKLTGTVSLQNHLRDNKVRIMVQNGEGHTPNQYEAGTSANATENTSITTSNENDLDRNQYDFTFAIESDTQYYNEDTPDNDNIIGKYEHQLNIHDWLIANRPRMNIQYLFHNGDIIDDSGMISQWENADAAYKKLDDANFPYGILAGNHDVDHLTNDYTNYSTYFGESRFNNNPWYGESYKDNKAHYDLITVGGIDFIMMYVGWSIGDEEIEWMNKVLQQYPERKAILNFHEYLLASGGLGEEPQRIFDEVVANNPNVCMVLSGHYHNAQTVVIEFDDNNDGVNDRKVYQMLFDYQGLPEGGMGYIRLMHFDLDNQKIIFRTYSPSLDDYNAKDTVAGGDTILGEETFEINFAELGIEPKQKVIETTNLDINVYTDKVIGTVSGVTNDSDISYTLENAENGVYGWYAEVKDDFGGLSRTNVNYFTVDKDIVKPTITLPEENEFPVEYEFNPMDGVVATDDRDGDITSKVVVEGTVDTSKEGNYTIVYRVSDNAGNLTEVFRVVTIKRIEKPNNGGNNGSHGNSSDNNSSNTGNSNDNVNNENNSPKNSNNKLPQTGDNDLIHLVVSGLSAIVLGLYILKKKTTNCKMKLN